MVVSSCLDVNEIQIWNLKSLYTVTNYIRYFYLNLHSWHDYINYNEDIFLKNLCVISIVLNWISCLIITMTQLAWQVYNMNIIIYFLYMQWDIIL